MLPQDVVSRAGDIDKLLKVLAVFATQHAGKLRREDEGRTLPLNPEVDTEISKEMSKVDVQQTALPCDQEVVAVPVTDSENVSGHTVARATEEEAVPRYFILSG